MDFDVACYYIENLNKPDDLLKRKVMSFSIKTISRYSAHIILYDDDRRILLQQRSDTATNFPGVWGFFGGGSKAGETPQRTIQRETREELSYRLRNPCLVAQDEVIKKKDGVILHVPRYVFIEHCLEKKYLKLQEGQGMGWFRFSEIKILKTHPQDREILAQVQKYLMRR